MCTMNTSMLKKGNKINNTFTGFVIFNGILVQCNTTVNSCKKSKMIMVILLVRIVYFLQIYQRDNLTHLLVISEANADLAIESMSTGV